MKDCFRGYYEATDDETSNAWNEGVFAFDANVLLNLYRYSELTRNDFIKALEKIKERLFLPYQAALEFHTNRLKVIEKVEKDFDEIKEEISANFSNNVKAIINTHKRNPSIECDDLIKIYEGHINLFKEEVSKQKQKLPDFRKDNQVLDKITKLFDNSIGKQFDETDLNKIYDEGKLRYKKQIPPGYKDSKKKDNDKFGDLIVWKELINVSKKEKKPLIFITDDRKEDWWRIVDGKKIRPREELIQEFYEFTKFRILIYTPDTFLSIAKEKGFLEEVGNDTIKEIEKVRISDDYEVYNLLDNFKKEIIQNNTKKRNLFDSLNRIKYYEDISDRSSFFDYPNTLKDFDKLKHLFNNKERKRLDEDLYNIIRGNNKLGLTKMEKEDK